MWIDILGGRLSGCIVSDLMLSSYIFFSQVSQIDVEAKQVMALHAVFDILLLYGVTDFSSQDIGTNTEEEDGQEGEEEAKTIISILSKVTQT